MTGGIVDDTHGHPGERLSDGAGDARAFERIRRQHSGLGHSVALEDRVTRSRAKRIKGFR